MNSTILALVVVDVFSKGFQLFGYSICIPKVEFSYVEFFTVEVELRPSSNIRGSASVSGIILMEYNTIIGNDQIKHPHSILCGAE